jgi:uncharacterized protein YbjT (DUF2867 family)
MILVTGASGKIGSELVKGLSQAGVKARAGYRSVAKAPKLAHLEAVAFDFDKPELVRAALAGVDRMFLLCAGPRQVEQEMSAADEAKRAGVKHVVKLSVWEAHKEEYQFARLHRAIEKKLESLGVPHTFLRPTAFMQNLLASAHTIKDEGAFYQPAGDARWPMIDVRDVARVAAKVLTSTGHEGKSYELTGPEALGSTDQARLLSEVIGKPIKFVDVPAEEFKKMMVGFGLPGAQVDGIVDLFRYYRTPAGQRATSDVEKLTGKRPGSFAQFARDVASAFR